VLCNGESFCFFFNDTATTEIYTNHDGKLDVEERAAWREKQRENYRQQAAGRTQPAGGQR
jgi:hypothetical protein